MKIEHKITNKIIEISFSNWSQHYFYKKKQSFYDVLDYGDLVMVRQVEKDGSRKEVLKTERDHALRMVKSAPHGFDFIELEKGGNIISNDFNLRKKRIISWYNKNKAALGHFSAILTIITSVIFVIEYFIQVI